MSIISLTPNTLNDWLKNETDHFLNPLQKEAEKNKEKLIQVKQDLIQISQELLEISQKEIDKRNTRVLNRARALNKLANLFLQRINKIKITENLSFSNFSKTVKETNQILLVNEVDIKNWFPRISPFFIRDRRKFITIHEKSKESLSEISAFVKEEYIKTKTAQETFQLISDLLNFENKLKELELERKAIEKNQVEIQKNFSVITEQLNSLQEIDAITQVSEIESKIQEISNEINYAFRRLHKSFVKMQALSVRGDSINLTSEEVTSLDRYIENPFDAITSEKINYPVLKQILEKLYSLLLDGKLKLKSDKKRKAQGAIKKILGNSILELQKQGIEKLNQKKQLLDSAALSDISNKKIELQEKYRKIQAKKARIDAHAKVKENKYNQIKSKINSQKKLIEKNVYESLNKTIKIES